MPSLRDFFVTVPITSLKFWGNLPTCFPNIFTVSSPLWLLRMQWHAGKQGTCRCIPRSCIFWMLGIVNYELHCTKNRSKPWWDRGCEPGLQYLCDHRRFVNSSNLPSLCSTKAKRPNRLITLKLFLTKKNKPFSPTFAQCKIHRMLTLREEQRAIFDPADSGLAFSSISLKIRERVCVLGTRIRWVDRISRFCTQCM